MANNVLRCIVTGGVMAMIPTAICWVFFGAHWFTTTYVCGPFPHGGFFNPSFGAWSACFGPSMMLSTMLPLAFAAGVLLALSNIRDERKWRERDAAREARHGG